MTTEKSLGLDWSLPMATTQQSTTTYRKADCQCTPTQITRHTYFCKKHKRGYYNAIRGKKGEERKQKQKQKFLPHKEAGVSQDYQLPDYWILLPEPLSVQHYPINIKKLTWASLHQHTMHKIWAQNPERKYASSTLNNRFKAVFFWALGNWLSVQDCAALLNSTCTQAKIIMRNLYILSLHILNNKTLPLYLDQEGPIGSNRTMRASQILVISIIVNKKQDKSRPHIF